MLTCASVTISTSSLTLRFPFSLQKCAAPNSDNEGNTPWALNFINKGERACATIPRRRNRSMRAPIPKRRIKLACALLSHVITRARTLTLVHSMSHYWQLTWKFGYSQACLTINVCALPLRHTRPFECALLMASLPLLRPSTSCTCFKNLISMGRIMTFPYN